MEKKDLTEEEKNIIIFKGTEYPFTGKYNDFFEEGIYCCKQSVFFKSKSIFTVCSALLFIRIKFIYFKLKNEKHNGY